MLLQRMVNPEDGLVGKCKFLPTLAEVKEWLAMSPCGEAPWKYPSLLKRKPMVEDATPEEVARRDAMWTKTKRLLEVSAADMRKKAKLPAVHRNSA
jgi:hypothetical protein